MRSIEEYQRIADNYDIAAFINGRDLHCLEIYGYVSDNMPWLDSDTFFATVDYYEKKGNQPVDSYIRAIIDHSKYPPITLAELDTYLEI